MKNIYYYKENYGDPSSQENDSFTLHRENGPAKIFDYYGYIIQEWYWEGKLHRMDGPAVIDNESSIDMYFVNGVAHNPLGGPSERQYRSREALSLFTEHFLIWGEKRESPDPYFIFYNEKGEAEDKRFFIKKNLGTDLPAYIDKDQEERVSINYWVNADDQAHRNGAPAIIHYHENGSIKTEFWYKDAKMHREDGPAHIDYDKDGNKEYEEWYLEGELIKSVKD